MNLKMILWSIREHMEWMKSDGMEYAAALDYGRHLSKEYDLPNTGLVDGIVMNVYES